MLEPERDSEMMVPSIIVHDKERKSKKKTSKVSKSSRKHSSKDAIEPGASTPATFDKTDNWAFDDDNFFPQPRVPYGPMRLGMDNESNPDTINGSSREIKEGKHATRRISEKPPPVTIINMPPAEKKDENQLAMFHGAMFNKFLKANGQDDEIAAATAGAFAQFLKSQQEAMTQITPNDDSKHSSSYHEEDDYDVYEDYDDCVQSFVREADQMSQGEDDSFAQDSTWWKDDGTAYFPAKAQSDRDYWQVMGNAVRSRPPEPNLSVENRKPTPAPPPAAKTRDLVAQKQATHGQTSDHRRRPNVDSTVSPPLTTHRTVLPCPTRDTIPSVVISRRSFRADSRSSAQLTTHRMVPQGPSKDSVIHVEEHDRSSSIDLTSSPPIATHRIVSQGPRNDVGIPFQSSNSDSTLGRKQKADRIPSPGQRKGSSAVSLRSSHSDGTSSHSLNPHQTMPRNDSIPKERSYLDQLNSLTLSQRACVNALKSKWESRDGGIHAFPDKWYLRFARCSPEGAFNYKSAYSVMKKCDRRYFDLNICDMEQHVFTKTVFPVAGLKSRDGHDMFYMRTSRYFPKQTPTSTMMDRLVYTMNCMLEKEQASLNGIGLVANMTDWTMSNFSVGYWHKFMMTLQGLRSPTLVELFLIVNPPSWFGSIWTIMKPMLSEEFRRKVHMISFHDMQKHLMKGYEEYLPDDVYTGTRNTDQILEEFVAMRKLTELRNE